MDVGLSDVQEISKIIYNIVFPLAILLGMFFIIKSGYTLMTSQGEPRKAQEGKEQLTSAIMGLIFVLISAVILRVIFNSLIGGGV